MICAKFLQIYQLCDIFDIKIAQKSIIHLPFQDSAFSSFFGALSLFFFLHAIKSIAFLFYQIFHVFPNIKKLYFLYFVVSFYAVIFFKFLFSWVGIKTRRKPLII